APFRLACITIITSVLPLPARPLSGSRGGGERTRMLKHLVTRGLAGTRSNRDNRRRACRLTVEGLESRRLLSGDMVPRWNQALRAAANLVLVITAIVGLAVRAFG